MRLLLISLLLSFILTNCPTEEDTDLVEMQASVNPEEAGEVNPPEGTYVAGREITISTEPAEEKWEFAGWSGDTTAQGDTLTFEITSDMQLVANYEIPTDAQHVLLASSQPQEGGTVDPDSGQYELGTSVDVEALPNEGWEFTSWDGDTTIADNPITVEMNKDYELVANFQEVPPETFTLSTGAQPTEGGAVDPAEGDYEEGTEISVEALPNDGWEFTDWSGDTTVSQNPLSIEMTKDYNLTANFYELPQSFSNQVTVSDGINSKSLIFGMDAAATGDYDEGIDEELPYITPPEGAFYRRFVITDYALRADYRAVQEQETVWEMEFAPEEGQTITLSWDFSNTNHVGTLELTDDPANPTFQVDMKSSTSYEVTDQSVGTLYIISNRGN